MPTRLVDALERMESGGHICSLYSTDEEQFASAIPFIRIGLQKGERCMYVAEEDRDLDSVLSALAALELDVPALIRSGTLILSTKRDSYYKGGHFSPERMLGFWKTEFYRARKDGYTGFRGTGVADCATLSSRGFVEWMEYESKATNIFAEMGCLCLCQYDRRLSSPELVLDVIRTHPVVIYGDTVCQNFYFVPPEEFLAPRQAEREIERLLRTLKDHERTGERLREMQRMEAMGHLAGGIAHDFNNLMGIVTGYSDLLQDALQDRPSLLEKVREIQAAGQEASSLTRQLLAFARRQMVQPKLLDPNAALANLEKMLRRLLSEDIEFVISYDSSVGVIRADRTQFDQVVMNLVLNARDAAAKGGRISVKLTSSEIDQEEASLHRRARSGPFVRLTVTDTGCGMDQDTISRIFEPFFSTKLQGTGTGLGLATVEGIVEQMGGFITVVSELGVGTSFSVYFPRIEGAVVTEADLPTLVLKPGSETILLVEDQKGLQSMIFEILRRNGYKVLAAGNGREALELLEAQSDHIDLVITDLVMPQMGGLELAETLQVSNPDVKVLYMSGYAEDIPSLLSPGRMFIEKPFPPSALLQKIAEILRVPAEPRARPN